MTARQIVDIVIGDLETTPDMSGMSLMEKVFCIGIYRVYKMYSLGLINKEVGKKLKTELITEFEHWQLYEDMFDRSVQAEQKACAAGVKLTKLLKSGAQDGEILDAALETLNVSGLSGGIPWEKGR